MDATDLPSGQPLGPDAAGGAVAFLVVLGALFSLNARTARTLQATTPRFPNPARDASSLPPK